MKTIKAYQEFQSNIIFDKSDENLTLIQHLNLVNKEGGIYGIENRFLKIIQNSLDEKCFKYGINKDFNLKDLVDFKEIKCYPVHQKELIETTNKIHVLGYALNLNIEIDLTDEEFEKIISL